jgi:undecaprenyl-phosphate 4-deoxy-4-formamido-L-arabinose transferase
MNISVVAPVYNSARSLRLLVDRLEPVLKACADQFELVLVDDESQDDSWGVILALSSDHSWIRGFQLMRNSGQHSALLCGIRAVRYDVVITIDDDLQHPPEEIPKLLDELRRGADVVYGVPEHEQHDVLRVLSSRLTKLALKSAMGVDVARNVSAFRAFRTRVREGFSNYSGSFVSIDVLLTWATTRFAATPVRHDERNYGTSQYTIRKLVTHALNMMTGFSVLPLQVASLAGLLFTLFGFGVLTFVLARWLIYGSVVPGFAFLASIISVFAGAQLFALGVIGEYLARMHFRIMDRPPYVIRIQDSPNPDGLDRT